MASVDTHESMSDNLVASKQASKQAKRSSALFSCQAENRTKTEGVFCPFPYGWDAPFLCVAGQ